MFMKRAPASESIRHDDGDEHLAAQVAADTAVYLASDIDNDIPRCFAESSEEGGYHGLFVVEHEEDQDRREDDIEEIEEYPRAETVGTMPGFLGGGIDVGRRFVQQPLDLLRTVAVGKPGLPFHGDLFDLLDV